MEKNHKDPGAMVDSWLEEILEKTDLPEEIKPDEQAITAAGLTHPDDAELERIVQESIAENWGDESTDQEVDDSTRFFEPQPEENSLEEYSSEVEETPEQEAEKEPETLIEKLRPKAKKGYGLFGIPHIISTVIWLMIIVFIGTTLGRTLWLCAADVLALGKTGKSATVMIEVSDRIPDIAQKLKEAGMIRYPVLFEAFASFTGKGENIVTGSISFKEQTVYDYNALINAMSYTDGALVTVEVMIPEGYSCAQIFALLEEKGVCSAAELEAYATDGEIKEYRFLKDIPRGHRYCLEGFMFPDTYEFYVDDEPRRVIEKFLDNFDYRFTNRMFEKFAKLNQKLGYVHLEMNDLVTMASIIEKEKANGPEGYTIASVFYNRLTHASSYPYLNSDATILYYTEYFCAGEALTEAQIEASPYNTYTQPGLPVGPIANPGLSSLDAALDPEDTDYYYFIYDESAGVHRFSKTLAEHEEWARKLGIDG